MLVGAVARIDDRRLQMPREQVRGAGRTVANHHNIDAHRFDVLAGINERFAFAQA